jgi:hypothetical protein
MNTQMDDQDNQYKLMSSYTQDPVSQLFQATRNTDEFERFGTAKQYTLEAFPTAFAKAEKRFYQLKSKKEKLLKQSGDEEALAKLAKEYQGEITKLNNLKGQVDTKIADKITELRKELKDKFKIDPSTYKGFEKTATADNRLELSQVDQLEYLLKKIRYLENFDEEAPSSEPNEEQARQDLKTLIAKKNGQDKDDKIHLVGLFNDLDGKDNQEKIAKFEKEYGSQAQ